NKNIINIKNDTDETYNEEIIEDNELVDYTATFDILVSFQKNISNQYDKIRKIKEKIEKSENSYEFVIKKVTKRFEKTNISSKKDKKRVVAVQQPSKLLWFRKFHFFFTKNHFLVLGGKNSSQNETLVKKYLEKNDFYFHGDIQGSASVILKSKIPKNIFKISKIDFENEKINKNKETEFEKLNKEFDFEKINENKEFEYFKEQMEKINNSNEMEKINNSMKNKELNNSMKNKNKELNDLNENEMEKINNLNEMKETKKPLNEDIEDGNNSYLLKDFSNEQIIEKPEEIDISQAADLTLCMSKCWENNVIGGVYYVSEEQVSKSCESGEYVTKGGFIVRGKKNYVTTFRLEMGVGIYFKLKNNLKNEEIIFTEKIKENEKKIKKNKKIKENKEIKEGDEMEENKKNKGRDEIKEIGIDEMEENKKNKGRDEIDKNTFKNIQNRNIIRYDDFIFVTSLFGDENVEYCFPYCAPWKSLRNNKFKVRLLPGNVKKGKLIKEVVGKFLGQANEFEKGFIKKVGVEEFMEAIFFGCKIGKDI
ncbi:DUF814 domain-containing protein, partial [Hamiltosporidium tvaerminnensis]